MLTDLQVDTVLDRVIAREGSRFTNNPADPGRATRYGVTAAALARWRDVPAVTAADVAGLTLEEARQCLRHDFLFMPGLDAISNLALADLAVDCAVNHGPPVAVKWLQIALGLTVDGVAGPITRNALGALDAAAVRRVYLVLCAARTRLYGRLITATPAEATFAAGWTARVARFVETAP